MMKIKILYLTTSPQLGGAEKMLLELATRIDKEKFEIVVCTIKGERDGDLLKLLRKRGIETYSLNADRKWQVHKLLKIRRIIKTFQPDIIQSYLFFDNIVAGIFGKLTRVPLVVFGQRNVETHRSFVRNLLDKFTLPLADFVISNTEAGKEIVVKREKFPADRVYVIANGIDMPEAKREKPRLHELVGRNKLPGQPFVAGFIGFMIEQKGIPYLLEAAEEIARSHPEVVFILIGSGPLKGRMKQLSDEINLGGKVIFAGHRGRGSRYMSLFDVFVLPSLWEGMPNVVMEAMAHSVPVVATKVGGVPELVEHGKTGYIVEPGDASALAKAVEKVVLMNPTEREAMGERGFERMKSEFTFDKMVKSYERLYTQFYEKRT